MFAIFLIITSLAIPFKPVFMKIQAKIIYLLISLCSSCLIGQNQIPLITGKAKFSVNQGTIECDLTLSEYAHLDEYVIRLNSGMNIRNIQSVEAKPFLLGYDRSLVDSLQTDETNAYYFPSSDRKGKFLPKKIRFQYVGMYPVVKDTTELQYQKSDWRGNIAFNNQILRIDGLQSAWIPTLYDIKNQYRFDKVRYDIEIECLDCDYLYINGNEPVKAIKARFKSEIPREMYLFLGKYNVQKSRDVTLLNTDFTEEQLQDFATLKNDISTFLKTYTSVETNQNIYWVQGNITSKNNAWSFVSFPTFTTCGYPPYDLKSTFSANFKNNFLQIISHELGHYYFGSLKKHNNTLENLLNEGFAEFLSLKYLESKKLNTTVSKIIKQKIDYCNDEGFELKPIGKFKNIADTNDRQTYAYDYQTLILLAIEKEIGEKKMQKWIQLLLDQDKPVSDFEFLKLCLKKTVKNDKLFNTILEKYLLNDSSLENISKTLN